MDLRAEDMVAPTTLDFDGCFRELFPGVARAAALVVRDRQLGPDIAQESFARLFERWDRIESHDHARNFVYRVAVNLARSHLRRRLAAPFGLAGPDAPAADPTGPSAAWLDAVAALEQLSSKQRACVVLVDYADLDAAAVSAILGMAEATVRVHLHRGRRALRARLDLPEEGAS
jgi:DNA-directed RNA polymerase specialized sigma24 family protein